MNIRTALSSRPRNFLVASLAAAAFALTACQGGGEPAAQPTPADTSSATAAPSTSTPSPTATATYKPADASGKAQNVPVPVKPALADENSKEGLEAFTKYWYSALGYAYETGDLSYVEDITGENCQLCHSAREVVGSWYGDGGWISGGIFSVPTVEIVFTPASDGNFQALAQVIQSDVHTYMPDGAEPNPPALSSNLALLLIATHSNGHWNAVDVVNVNG